MSLFQFAWGRRTRRSTAVIAAFAALALATGCAAGVEDGAEDAEAQESEMFDQALHDSLPDRIKESGQIIAAGDFANPPFLTANPENAEIAEGLAPSLSAGMSEILGVDFVWKNTGWPGQLPGLDAGTFDVVWGQVSVTAERELGIVDLVSFFQDGLGLLVLKGNPEGVTDLESTCGLKVGVTIGSLYIALLNHASDQHCVPNGLPPIEVLEYQDNSKNKVALLAGAIDGVLDAYTGGVAAAAADPDGLEVVKYSDEEAYEFDPGLRGIAVKKTNPELTIALGKALDALVENGFYAEALEANGLTVGLPGEGFYGVNPLTGTAPGEIVE